jgi:kinesin family protein 18/19
MKVINDKLSGEKSNGRAFLELEVNTNCNQPRLKSYCRIRPSDKVNNSFFKFEEKNNFNFKPNVLHVISSPLSQIPHKFYFDNIFDEAYTQIEIFQDTTLGLIDSLVDKMNNSIIIVHGLQNSGKTFTVVGESDNPGIIPLGLRLIYDKVKEKNDPNLKVYCNYIEIFNDKAIDLLSDEQKILAIPRLSKSNKIQNAKYFQLNTIQDFSNAINIGNKKKKMNKNNSLSHTIFKIILRKYTQHSYWYDESSLSILDLASPVKYQNFDNLEKVEETNEDKVLYSHHCLCKCLKALNRIFKIQNSRIRRGDKEKMNYCEVMNYLRYFFYGNESIVLITNINPNITNVEENLRVLQFSLKFENSISNIDRHESQLK